MEQDGIAAYGMRYGSPGARSGRYTLRWMKRSGARLFVSGGLAVLIVLMPASSAAAERGGRELSPTSGLTLDGAVRLALRNNRSLLDARLARITQKFALKVAEERYDPTLAVTPSVSVTRSGFGADVTSEAAVRVPTGGRFVLSWSGGITEGGDGESGPVVLRFEQPLLRGGGFAVDSVPVQVARLREKLHFLSFRSAVGDVVVSVIEAYRRVLLAKRRVKIDERSLVRLKRQLEVNRALVEAGRMARQDVVQSEAGIVNQEIRLTEAGNALDSARLSLLALLGLESRTRLRLSDDIRFAPEDAPPGFERSLDSALRNRPDYLRERINVEIAEAGYLEARNALLPDLSLFSRFGFDVKGDERDEYSAGLEWRVRLGDRSREKGLLEARVSLRRAQNALARLRESIGIDIRRAVQDVRVKFRQIEYAGRARQFAERKLATGREKLRLGLSSNFELTRFEEDLTSAQNAEVEAVVSYLNARTALDRSLGRTLEVWRIDARRVEE